MTLQSLEGNEAKDGTSPVLTFNPLSVTQWSLFAVCLFFCTGHWYDSSIFLTISFVVIWSMLSFYCLLQKTNCKQC